MRIKNNNKEIRKKYYIKQINAVINKMKIIIPVFKKQCGYCNDFFIGEKIIYLGIPKWKYKGKQYLCLSCSKRLYYFLNILSDFIPEYNRNDFFHVYQSNDIENYTIDLLTCKFQFFKIHDHHSQDEQWEKDYKQALEELGT